MDQKYFFPLGLILLWLGLFFVYWQTFSFSPLNYDDHSYLNLHPLAQESLASPSFWFSLFQSATVNLWTPLTDLSHQILFRVSPSPALHHFCNLLLHGINATLWAFLLRFTTKNTVLALASALLFAWHPLSVESVAWISGRKDLLCTFFITLSLFSHCFWIQTSAKRYFIASLLLAVAATLSKPIAFVLPLLLLVFDLWPLQRSLRSRSVYLEKIPFLGISLVSVFITLHFQSLGGQAVDDGRNFFERVAGAFWAIQHSFSSLLWPFELHLNYTDPTELNIKQILLVAGGCLAGLAVILQQYKLRPYLLTALLWYLLTLGPTLGLIRAGNHLAADRYLYLPLLGLLIGITSLLQHRPKLLVGLLLALAFPLLLLTHTQVSSWRSLDSLSQKILAHQPQNPSGHHLQALTLSQQGNTEEAHHHLAQCLKIQPTHTEANLLLAQLLYQEEDFQRAYHHFLVAAQLRTQEAWIQERLAITAYRTKRPSVARDHLLQAIALAPQEDSDLRLQEKWNRLFPKEAYPAEER